MDLLCFIYRAPDAGHAFEQHSKARHKAKLGHHYTLATLKEAYRDGKFTDRDYVAIEAGFPATDSFQPKYCEGILPINRFKGVRE